MEPEEVQEPLDAARTFIRSFMVAVSNCSLYGEEHGAVDELVATALSAIRVLQEQNDRVFDLKVIEGDIIINNMPVADTGAHGLNLARKLRRRGLSEVRIGAAVTLREVRQFLTSLAVPDTPVEGTSHITVGTVSVRVGGIKVDDLPGGEAGNAEFAGFRNKQLDTMREVMDNVSPFRQLSVSGLEDIVVNFIVTFKKQANILSLVSPVRSYSEYTYTHATNVSVLAMHQAEALGFGNDLLHDIGIGALLHDVGKLFVSNEILEKKGKLDDREWEEIRRHPAYGVRYLSRIEGLPRLAPVLAFEHHMRYDGGGYPSVRVANRSQSFCSQIVAIADFFDALRSRRPYKRDWTVREIIALMKENAGREFNPFLVDNFARLMEGKQGPP